MRPEGVAATSGQSARVEVRLARPDDLDAVDRLLIETFGGSADSAFAGAPAEVQITVRRRLRRLAARPDEGLIVAVDGDRIVGVQALATAESYLRPSLAFLAALRPLGPRGLLRYCVAAWAGHRPAADEAYLFALAVAPSHRRQGVAERLLRRAEQEAGHLGKTVVTSDAAPTNRASLSLLEKCGFCPTEPAGRQWRRLIRPAGPVHLRKTIA